MKLAFIGGGNMAQAILAGLNSQQFTMSDITVIELDAEKQQTLQRAFGVSASARLSDVANSEMIVLAVKPQQLPALAKNLGPLLQQQLIVSIAAGVRLKDLSAWLGHYPTVARAMLN